MWCYFFYILKGQSTNFRLLVRPIFDFVWKFDYIFICRWTPLWDFDFPFAPFSVLAQAEDEFSRTIKGAGSRCIGIYFLKVVFINTFFTEPIPQLEAEELKSRYRLFWNQARSIYGLRARGLHIEIYLRERWFNSYIVYGPYNLVHFSGFPPKN